MKGMVCFLTSTATGSLRSGCGLTEGVGQLFRGPSVPVELAGNLAMRIQDHGPQVMGNGLALMHNHQVEPRGEILQGILVSRRKLPMPAIVSAAELGITAQHLGLIIFGVKRD